jgi:hypothetical protein
MHIKMVVSTSSGTRESEPTRAVYAKCMTLQFFPLKLRFSAEQRLKCGSRQKNFLRPCGLAGDEGRRWREWPGSCADALTAACTLCVSGWQTYLSNMASYGVGVSNPFDLLTEDGAAPKQAKPTEDKKDAAKGKKPAGSKPSMCASGGGGERRPSCSGSHKRALIGCMCVCVCVDACAFAWCSPAPDRPG